MKRSRFNDVLEAVERLTLDERETLVQIVRQRAAEQRRAQIIRDVMKAKRQARSGKITPATVEEIMRRITR